MSCLYVELMSVYGDEPKGSSANSPKKPAPLAVAPFLGGPERGFASVLSPRWLAPPCAPAGRKHTHKETSVNKNVQKNKRALLIGILKVMNSQHGHTGCKAGFYMFKQA